MNEKAGLQMIEGGVGRKFLYAVLTSGDNEAFLGHGNIGPMFIPSEAVLYEFVQTHFQEHGALPSAELVFAETNLTIKKKTAGRAERLSQGDEETLCPKASSRDRPRSPVDGGKRTTRAGAGIRDRAGRRCVAPAGRR
jgi:hypothetical protein